MKTKKNKIGIGLFCLMLVAFVSCGTESELGLEVQDGIAPGVPTIGDVIPTPGGSIIYFTAPKDKDLLNVTATYVINGVTRTTKASAYVDHLIVDGFGINPEYQVYLTSVDKSQNVSASVAVTIIPQEPPVQAIFKTLEVVDAFGGISITWDNPSEANVIIGVNTKDTLGDWVYLEDIYTNSKVGLATIRNLDTLPQDFEVFVRDRWDNYSKSDTVTKVPLFEAELAKNTFEEMVALPGSAEGGQVHGGNYPISRMWDKILGDNCYHGQPGDIGKFITFDMGVTAKLSRFKMYPRWYGTSTWLYTHNNLRRYEVWGAATITPSMRETGSLEGWVLLKDALTRKPSGPDPLPITDEDVAYAKAGDDQDISIAAPPVRYIRIEMKEAWSGGNIPQIGEMTFWGQVEIVH